MLERLRMHRALRPLTEVTPPTISLDMWEDLSEPRPPFSMYSSWRWAAMSRCRSMKARPISSPKSYTRSAPSGDSRSSGSTSSSFAPVSTMALTASLSMAPCRAFSTAILAAWALS